MNTIYFWPRQLGPFCRGSFFKKTFIKFSSTYQPRYNSEEQDKILQVINDSSAEELSRFAISKYRSNNIQEFRQKHGPFSTLGQVLLVDGLGVKVLEKLCDGILRDMSPSYSGDMNDSQILKHIKSVTTRSKTQLVIPALKNDQVLEMQTAVGIHVGVSAVTWAQMDQRGNLLTWDIYNLEFGSKRLHLTHLFDVARDICDTIAKADIYVLEDRGISAMSPAKQQQPSSITINLQNFQLTAMIVALLNGSLESLKNELRKYENTVFFLRSRLPARLFRTLVGSERVSAQSVVLDILSHQFEAYNCSPIKVSDELKEEYLDRTAREKESLCSALLLIMTFMDVVVHKNPISLQNIRNGR